MGTPTALPAASPKVRTILLVDDQSFIGMALTHLLATEADLELHCCLDAEAAVARANEIGPDLILQDLVMPGLDGLTLVKLFRENPATARTPVVVLSGNDDAETRARAFAAGAKGYLVKLPAKDELVSRLRDYLAGNADAVASPDAAATNSDAIDLSVLGELGGPGLGDASGFVRKLIDQFVQEMDSQVDALHDASRQHESAAMQATAHRLKGAAATMGAEPLAALCTQLEKDLGRPTPTVQTFDLVAAIAAEASRVRVACVRERERIGSRA